MQKCIAILLVITLLCTYTPTRSAALELVVDDSSIFSGIDTASSDKLFAQRAELLLDYEANQEAIAQVDKQLLEMGVEQITYAEVLEKMGVTAQPMYDVYSTEDTSWYSQRWVAVINGTQYEVQIVTGQAATTDSPLYLFEDGAVTERFGTAVGNVTAAKVLGASIVTSSISAVYPTVGTVLTAGITLYDAMSAYYEGISPVSVIDDADFSVDVYMTTTMRFGFVKYQGSLDNGNQIMGYVGNMVNYTVYIDIPTLTIENGATTPGRTTVEYSDSSKSYAYDIDELKYVAANNFKDYKSGSTSLDIYHDITHIPFMLLDTYHSIDVPYEFAYIREN